jgi:hypothetical protein
LSREKHQPPDEDGGVNVKDWRFVSRLRQNWTVAGTSLLVAAVFRMQFLAAPETCG